MENEKWNSDEWQGRSKERVERNNKVFGYSILLVIIFFILFSLKSCFNL
jgi:t-SNARE complex subunit (syntaxin)